MKSRLVKSKNKIIAGICGGIAEYIDWDPAWVRVLYVVFSLVTAVLAGLLLYLILWIAMPEPDAGPDVKTES